jgi:hypothetical protein
MVSAITRIDLSRIADQQITVYCGTEKFPCTGVAALELVWTLKPSALEGIPHISWVKNAWMFHNFVGHPLMQILALFGKYKLAMKIHDATVAKPKGFKL